MTLLATILPGVRDLRAQLTAGSLWLGSIYMLCAHMLTHAADSEAGHRLNDLVATVGPAPVLALLLLFAYLLGSLSISIMGQAVALLTRRADRIAKEETNYYVVANRQLVRVLTGNGVERQWRGLGRRLVSWFLVRHIPIRANGVSSTYRGIDAALGEDHPAERLPELYRSMARHPSVHYDTGDDELTLAVRYDNMANWFFAQAVFHDVFRAEIASRLLTSPDLQPLYQEYDRQKAEADLRLAAVVPGILLGSIVILTAGLSAIGSVASLAILQILMCSVYMQGVGRRAQAGDVLAVAVGDGVIATPTLEMVKPSGTNRPLHPDHQEDANYLGVPVGHNAADDDDAAGQLDPVAA